MKAKSSLFVILFLLFGANILFSQTLHFCKSATADNELIGEGTVFKPGKVVFVIDSDEPFGVPTLQVFIGKGSVYYDLFYLDVEKDDTNLIVDDDELTFKQEGDYHVMINKINPRDSKAIGDLVCIGTFHIAK